MPPMIPAERICIICEKVDGKYKCTKCSKYTCSLPCSKAHREVHDNEPQPPNAGDSSSRGKTAAGAGEEDDEPEGGHSPLSKLFKKYPELPQQLRDIADATDPPKDGKSGGNSSNNRFNPRGGRGGNKRQEPWTKEIGLQNGMNLLRRNLASPSPQQSEGLREYCELFKHENALKAEQGEDPDALFRRRAAEHDAEVIRKLMEEENQKD